MEDWRIWIIIFLIVSTVSDNIRIMYVSKMKYKSTENIEKLRKELIDHTIKSEEMKCVFGKTKQ